MTTFIIALFITYFIILIWKGGGWFSKENYKQGTMERALYQSKNNNTNFIEKAIDNRGYDPYDGLVLYKDGVYSTIIFGNKDYPITRYLNANSIEELQNLADPFLEEHREAWIKRKNKQKKK